MMPEMTGMELYQELLHKAPDLAARMIFVTGAAVDATVTMFLDRVPNKHLEKPFDLDQLRKAIRQTIRRSDRSKVFGEPLVVGFAAD